MKMIRSIRSIKLIRNLADKIRLRTWISLLLIAILLPIILFTLFKPSSTEAEWFDEAWAYRKKITIDGSKVSGSTDFTNFPIMINQATDSDLSANAQADGDDILFTTRDGVKLDHEIEKYDNSTGQLVAWVKVNTLLAGEDSVLYMYYGNASSRNQQNPEAVWDDDFVMVQHLEETSASDTFTDSTANNLDSTSVTIDGTGSDPNATGVADGAVQFDGSNDLIQIGHKDSLNSPNDMTLSFWFKWDQLPSTLGREVSEIFRANDGTGDYPFSCYSPETGTYQDKIVCNWRNSSDTNYTTAYTGTAFSIDTWYHITVLKSGSSLKMYVDGSDTNTTTGTPSGVGRTITAGTLRIGALSTSYYWLDGFMDEVQYSKAARSADWIATNFNTQNHLTSAFYSMDSSEVGPGPIAYWKFDEGVDNTCSGGTNDVCDSTSSGNDGAITGATWQTKDMCVSGKCLYFDGTDDVVTVSNTVSGVQTVSFWAKVMSTSTTEQLIDLNGTDYLTSVSGTVTAAGFGTETIYVDGQVNTTISANKWHHIAVTTSSGLSASAIKFGQISTNYGNVFIDEVKIYPYARSADQIKVDYNAGAAALGVKTQSWLSEGLVGYWSMDEANGTNVADASGNGNTGTLTNAQETGTSHASSNTTTTLVDNGGATLSSTDDAYNGMILDVTDSGSCALSADAQRIITDYNGTTKTFTVGSAYSTAPHECPFTILHQVGGKFGNGMEFDGSNDYVTINHSTSIEPTNELTYSAWIKLANTTGDKYIIQKNDGNVANYRRKRLYITNNDELYFSVYDGATDYTINTTSYNLQTNTWYHVVATIKDNDAMRLYINGIEVDSDTTIGDILLTEDENLYIGAYIHGGSLSNYFNGLIDDVRIYNRLLSNKEVRDLYNWAPGPVAHYKFDENSGTTTTFDSSGNGLNATMNNMTSSDWKAGKFGSALNFEYGAGSTSKYLQVTDSTDSALDLNTQGSISVWAKSDRAYPSDTGDIGYRGFVHKGGSLSSYTFHWHGNDSTSNMRFYKYDGTSWEGSNYSIGALTPGQWNHFAVSWDRSSMKFYFNGELIGTYVGSGSLDVISQNTNDAVDIGVGYGWYTTERGIWDGLLDDIRIYNYKRTTQQIVEDMNAGHPTGGSPIGSQVAYWKFDEMYGTTTYSSVGSHDMTLTCAGGGCTNPAWTASGKVNSTLEFNPQSTSITSYLTGSVLNIPSTAGEQITITAWIKPDATQYSSSAANIVRNGTGADRNYQLSILNDDQLEFNVYDTDYRSCESSVASLTTQAWNHVAAVFTQGSNVKFYVDGKLIDTVSCPYTSVQATTNLVIGATNNSQPYGGFIDELKIYNSALTADQILIDMNAGSAAAFSTFENEADDITDGAGNPPVGYWPMDENTGTTTIYDKSGNGRNGTMNSMSINVWESGKYGSAIHFDGSNDDVTVAQNSAFEPTDITVSAWVRLDDINKAQTIVSQTHSTSPYYSYKLYINSSNEPQFIWHNTTSDQYSTTHTGSDLEAKKWYHIVGVKSGSTLNLYLNGTDQYTTADTTTGTIYDSDGSLFIGEDDSSDNMDGLIDEVKIYNYARTPAQIAYDYNRGKPVGWWKFDECEGATVYDSSGNGYNGTITSGSGTIGTCGGSAGEMWANGATGKRNASLDFNSSESEYVSTSTMGNFGSTMDTNAASFSTWLKSSNTTSVMFVMGTINDGTTTNLQLIVNADYNDALNAGYITLYYRDDDGNILAAMVQSNTGVTDGNWHHVVWTVDGDDNIINIYLDGVAQTVHYGAQQTADNASNFQYPLVVGARNLRGTINGFFDGLIDDVRIYNYALSATQVKNIMNNGAVFYGPDTGSP